MNEIVRAFRLSIEFVEQKNAELKQELADLMSKPR